MTEWWNTQSGAWFGATAGTAVGIVGGGMGALIGTLAPRGRAKGAVLSTMGGLIVLGAVALAVGVYALATGQPRHVWYPLVMIGGVLALVFGPLFPVIRTRYREAEMRRLSAEELRRA